MGVFTTLYFVAIVMEMIIRAPLNRKRRQDKMSEQRVRAEEQLMLERFGERYGSYMQKVGSVLPKI